VNFADHPQSAAPKGKYVILTIADHHRLIKDGVQLMDEIN
jgi:hypothetical protein